jgi:adenylosuccinate lyase
MEELTFMLTENMIMKMVSKGASRQEAHEEIRVLSHQASDVVKKEGGRNDLLDRIKKTKYFEPIWSEIDSMIDPKNFIGRSAEIVQRYCGEGGEVEQALAKYGKHIEGAKAAELTI